MVLGIRRVVYWKIVVGRIKMEVLVIIVGEVHRVAAAVAYNEQLHEAHQCIGVAVAAVLLVVHNLFNGLHRRNAVALELNLDQRQTIYEDDDIVALAAISSVDGELVHHFIVVLAPVPQIHEAVIEGGAIVAHESLFLAQSLRCGEHVGSNVFLKKFAEFIVREGDEIEPFELLAEVLLQRIKVTNVASVGEFQLLQFVQELLLELCFALDHVFCVFVEFRVQIESVIMHSFCTIVFFC